MPTVDDMLARAQACYRAGRFGEAEQLLGQVLRRDGDNVEALCFLSATYHALRRPADAVGVLEHALRVSPGMPELHNDLGVALKESGRRDEAMARYRQALALKPDFAAAHNNLGVALMEAGRLAEAESCYRTALALQPEYAEAHFNLGIVLSRLRQLDDPVAWFRRTVELRPGVPTVYNTLAIALLERQEFDEGLAWCDRALALAPNFAEAHYNRSLAWLVLGRFDQGWPEYEWRWQRPGKAEPVLPQPRWNGAPLAGQTILMRCEQGLGDTLQFVRYAPMLQQRGGRVVVECQPALIELVATCPGVERVIARGEPLGQFDVHLPLLSVPGVLGTTLNSIPAEVPYLTADSQLVAEWEQRLAAPPAFKIGIAWKGNAANPRDAVRSIPLRQFAGLAQMPGVRVYSLQMGEGREQLAGHDPAEPIIDLSDRPPGFHHTAAIVQNLDLVISCDSAPAHLAGALGLPIWLALPWTPDWRWLLDRDDSPWYPTMRLFRQQRPGDWEEVFRRIESALTARLQLPRTASTARD